MKFIGWKSNEESSRTWDGEIKARFTYDTTITASYDKEEDIIQYDPKEPKSRPSGYVRITFEADSGINLSNLQAYYVKENSQLNIDKLTKPNLDEDIGYEFTGWDQSGNLNIGTQDIVIRAKAIEFDKVISEEDASVKPKGYKAVSYTHLTLPTILLV